MRLNILLLGAAIAITACKGSERKGGDTTAAADTGTRAATGAGGVMTGATNAPPGAATVMHVVLNGGPDAGSYDMYSMDRTCSVGTNEVDQWSNQFMSDTVSKGLSALQITIPNQAKAKTGTDQFNVGLTIGSMMQGGKDYVIETRPTVKPNRGSGTAKVEDDGGVAVITIKGQTADGVGIDAMVRCQKVSRGR